MLNPDLSLRSTRPASTAENFLRSMRRINVLAAVAFAILPVRIKELVYGNIQQGDDLVKGIQAWMLTPVFKIHDRAWGTVYKLCKIFLRPTFCLSLALDLPA